MKPPSFLSITDQVTEFLRAEILRSRWSDKMPGKHELAAELGVNNKTVEAALRQLETAGLLLPQGAGKRRLINLPKVEASRTLRIAIIPNESPVDEKSKLYAEINHALRDAGHAVIEVPTSLTELQFDPKKVAKIVARTEAEAWIVYAGSRVVLEWFVNQSVPTFALFGHRAGLKIPSVGPDKLPALSAATRHLIGLGHRRIVLLCRRIRRLPRPGPAEELFLNILRDHHCPVGSYNLPDWDDTNEEFQRCLHALFQVTPPTALIVDEAPYFVAAMQFLLSQGLRVPGDVSLVCTDDDPCFAHCAPPVARITWDIRPIVRRITQWAANVSRGKPDFRQTLTPATFVPGGTTARVAKEVFLA